MIRRVWFLFICLLIKMSEFYLSHFIIFSTRQYTVPDPPGLFDGHVWPMYLKHRKEMEDSDLNIGMLQLGHFIFLSVGYCPVFIHMFLW